MFSSTALFQFSVVFPLPYIPPHPHPQKTLKQVSRPVQTHAIFEFLQGTGFFFQMQKS